MLKNIFYTIPVTIALGAFWGLKNSLMNNLSNLNKYALGASKMAFAGYILLLVALAIFAIILPILSEMKGRKRHVHGSTLLAITMLLCGVFALDKGGKNVEKQDTFFQLQNLVISKKVQAQEAAQKLIKEGKSLFDLILLGDKIDGDILKAVIKNVPSKKLTQKSSKKFLHPGYTPLGYAVRQGNKAAVDALLKYSANIKLNAYEGSNLLLWSNTTPLKMAISQGEGEIFCKIYDAQKHKTGASTLGEDLDSAYENFKKQI